MIPRRTISEQAWRIARQYSDFLITAEGKQQVENALEKARENCSKLHRMASVDPKVLTQPFTI